MKLPLFIVFSISSLSSWGYAWWYDEPVLVPFASGLFAGMALLGLLLEEIDWHTADELPINEIAGLKNPREQVVLFDPAKETTYVTGGPSPRV